MYRTLYHSFLAFIILYFFGSTEALEFARTNLTPFGKVKKYEEKLEVCFKILSICYLLYIFIYV